MKKLRKKLTYTNVVGTMALFLALGGVSWAASLPKNSVGTAQLKKNAVTAKAIKDKTIVSGDFKNSTISSGKINLATVGTVPRAANAGSADAVGGELQPVARRVAPSASNADSTLALHAAIEVPLLANDQVSIVGKCYVSGSTLYGTIIARTTADGAISTSGAGIFNFGAPFYLNAGRADEASYVLQASTGTNSAVPIGGPPFIGLGTVVGPNGHGFDFQAGGFIKNGNPGAGDGPYGAGQVCIFNATGARL